MGDEICEKIKYQQKTGLIKVHFFCIRKWKDKMQNISKGIVNEG